MQCHEKGGRKISASATVAHDGPADFDHEAPSTFNEFTVVTVLQNMKLQPSTLSSWYTTTTTRKAGPYTVIHLLIPYGPGIIDQLEAMKHNRLAHGSFL